MRSSFTQFHMIPKLLGTPNSEAIRRQSASGVGSSEAW